MTRPIALTHVPSPAMQTCERTFIPVLPIDGDAALRQFTAYCEQLRSGGYAVRTLDVNQSLPDCAFVEDTAIILDELAVLASMGTESRRTEPRGVEPVLREYTVVERIELPATVEGGDVLRIGRTLVVGQSRRTNAAGIEALRAIAQRHGYRVISVPVRHCLHLKTACTTLPDGRLLVNPAWIDAAELDGFTRVPVPREEPWGANAVLLGPTVLLAAAHVQTAEVVRQLGFDVATVDLSEFAKAEGGATCLSLLIPRSDRG